LAASAGLPFFLGLAELQPCVQSKATSTVCLEAL